MNTELPENKMLWRLAEDKKPQTSLWQFTELTQEYHNSSPDDYAALHDWSINSPNEFYSSLWDFLNIIGDKGEVAYVANDDIKKVSKIIQEKLK